MKSAVILFIYNRPEHTKKVLDGLRKNKIDEIYVFSDGSKNKEDYDKVFETRKLIDSIDWCKINAVYNEKNIGLAESVIKGVTMIFKRGYESVIVLEDDCIPNEKFIEFMNENLAYYKNNKQVMHISGFGLPIKKYTSADVYFTEYPCSWGWGTWKEVWEGCDFYQDDNYQALIKNQDLVKEFNYPGEAFSVFLNMQLKGEVSSWLIRWYYYIFINKGLCIWSYKSLIDNKGFDGTGNHKVRFDRFNQKRMPETIQSNNKPIVFEDGIFSQKEIICEFRRYFNGKGFLEKFKTIVYILTGLLLEKR